MWTGVTKGFAIIKFSGSPSFQGMKKQIYLNIKIIIKNPKKSFVEKYG